MIEPSSRRFQILALSGGGYRGLFGAKFLAECEKSFAVSCRDRFDIIAGTSVGALLAAGLSASVRAETLAAMMEEYGSRIFSRSITTGAKRLLFAAPYSQDKLREIIHKVLGKPVAETSLSNYSPPLIITAVNYSTSETCVFRSKGVAGAAASSVSIEDAILASAAAPTFFPTKKIGPCEYIDGGLVANAPDMVALLDALNFLNARADEVYQLSLGTASRTQGAAFHEHARAPGAISWMTRRRLVQTIMAAQEHLVLAQMQGLLQGRFMRIDEEPAEKQVRAINSLDRASADATETLRMLANKSWEKHKTARPLRNFFRH